MTYSSAEASGVWPSRAMPGACLMTSASGPSKPLVISLSDAAAQHERAPRRAGACSAAAKPAAIDSTDTNTTTTPAMPMMATADELKPLRNRPHAEREHRRNLPQPSHLTSLNRRTFERRTPHDSLHALLSASVIRSRMAATRRHDAGQDAHRHHQPHAEQHVARRQQEDRQQAAGRVAALHEQPGEPRARARRRSSTMNSDSASTSARIAAVRKPERLQDRELAGALADRLRHRARGDQPEHEQHHRRDRHHDRADVADLLGEALDEALLGRRLASRPASWRTSRRTSRLNVDRLRRIGDLDDVPADLPLLRGRLVLVEVVVAEEELRLVDAARRRRRCPTMLNSQPEPGFGC